MNNVESKPKDLETVKDWLTIARENNNKLAIQIIENLFPEVQVVIDLRIKEAVLKMVHDTPREEMEDNYGVRKEEVIDWLEKQGEKPIEQDTEIKDLWVYISEWKDKFGRLPKDEDELAACIDYVMKRQKPIELSDDDMAMIQDAIHWVQEFQKSDRCKDENDMQNSVTCENWLKNILVLCQNLK